MASINVSNLEIQISRKLSNATNRKEIAILSKALSLLKTGGVYTQNSLPSANVEEVGKLYYVNNLLYYVDTDSSGTYRWIVWGEDQYTQTFSWGSNTCGKLGDGTTVSRLSPTFICDPQTTVKDNSTGKIWNFSSNNGWIQLSAGCDHSLGIKCNGTLWVWGCNGQGRLGNGTTVNRCSPVAIQNQIIWCQISAGSDNSTGITTDGTLLTWGVNTLGKLGDGTQTSRCSPGTVAGGGTTWCQISAGELSTASVKTDGTIWTWGSNCCGVLGDGTVQFRTSPGTIAGGGTEWRKVSSGRSHTLAVKSDGTIWSWGCGGQGRLGDGTTVNKCSPIIICREWSSVTSGSSFSAGIKPDGTLWTWGNNYGGSLGTGTTVSRCSPGTVAGGGTTWRQVTLGCFMMLGLKTDGTLWTWGLNGQGKLGDGTTVRRSSPGTVAGGGTTWCCINVSGESYTSGGIKTDGTLWTWGSNTYGNSGNGTTADTCSPGTVAGGGTNWCAISTDKRTTMALKTDGTLWVWGDGSNGILGDGTTITRCSPGTTAGGGTTWSSICNFSRFQMAAIKTDGTLWTWGLNNCGVLGDGTTINRSSPGTVTGFGSAWCQISGARYHMQGIKTDGTLWTWGINRCGVLGDGTFAARCSPGTVSGGGITWCQVSGGYQHAIAVKTDGTIWAWGYRLGGRLGNGIDYGSKSTPEISGDNEPWTDVFSTYASSIGLKCDGTIWTWGRNSSGMLGDGTTVSRSSPGTVAGGGTSWCQISAGRYSMTALKTDGTIWTWGCNAQGRLGTGTTVARCSPGTIANVGTDWVFVSSNITHSLAIRKKTL
jgi:alpha-tubulin suppressor-like RCC1 family protein